MTWSVESVMFNKVGIKNILKRSILISGAVARSVIGTGGSLLILFALKNVVKIKKKRK